MTLKDIIVLFTLVILGSGVILIWPKKKHSTQNPVIIEDSNKKTESLAEQKINENEAPPPQPPFEEETAEQPGQTPSFDHQEEHEKAEEQSHNTKTKFLNETYLDASLPKEFIYSEMDTSNTDDPITIILGKHKIIDSHLLVAATTMTPQNPYEVLQYFKENSYLFPHIDESLLAKMKLTQTVNNPREGFKQMNILEAHNSKTSKSEVLVYLLRKDRKGTYVFSYSGHSQYLENEDYFDELLSTFRTHEVPKGVFSDSEGARPE